MGNRKAFAAAAALAFVVAGEGARAQAQLPNVGSVDAEQAMGEVNALFGHPSYKPFDVAVFASATQNGQDVCGEVRLVAKDSQGPASDPAETELEALPPVARPAADPLCAAPPSGTAGNGPGVTPLTPPDRLASEKRLKRLFRGLAKAVFGNKGAAKDIRRVQIAFGYSNAEAFEIASETLVALSLHRPEGGAPGFEYLVRIEPSSKDVTWLTPRPGVARVVAARYDGPLTLVGGVGSSTGWKSYRILDPVSTKGPNRKVRVTYQYNVSGRLETWSYTGKCSTSTVQDALSHWKDSHDTNFCQCTVPNGSNKCP